MVSREHKRAVVLHEKLQLLRSITHSHADNDNAIILDASKYIEDLKDKVDRLNQDIINNPQSSTIQDLLPQVTVETLEKGFLINVYSEKSYPGLLVSVLEAFEELNLTLVEARASCTQNFQLEAISVEGDENGGEIVDAQVVRRTVSKALSHWNTISTDQQDQ
ncbi:uncharacterized protein LOC104908228 [Beta vulgaris subsp. vulgaris]|uniref:uncharacterized protein LOC104908228 n=1 Tax=Beta vulgaris subsp. vulgaris TaxID=3555 RepID=UPI002036AD7C|nr:uncharacterized protein LOC104908228 [Beta vulgaris subsp. vulgaris]